MGSPVKKMSEGQKKVFEKKLKERYLLLLNKIIQEKEENELKKFDKLRKLNEIDMEAK